MPRTSGDYDLELTLSDGVTTLGLMMPKPRDQKGAVIQGAPLTLEEALAASDADAPISEALTPLVQESWFRGVGLDYDWSPGVDTRDPDYACPAGACTDVTIPAGGAGAIVAVEEFGADIFLAQIGNGTASTGRVLRLTGGVAPLSVSIAFGVGRYCRGLVVGDDGSGNTRLYAMTSDSGTQNGALHEWDGAAWISTTAGAALGASRTANGFLTNGRGPAKKVTWRGRDGIKNNAIVTKSGPKKISYTKLNGDPMLGANWTEGVPISTGYELIELAAARGHIWFSARDNLFDLDEVGNSPGVTDFIGEQVQPGNGDAVQFLDTSVYYSMGRGLLKIDVGQDGTVQTVPGQCAPGAFLPVEGCPRGYVTAMCPDQSWLVTNVFDTTSRTSNVFWGKPREQLGIESPNPMIWHGPLLRMETDYRVTKLRTSALAGDLRLWVASIGDSSGTVRLSWMSLPLAGTTLQDQAAGGAHRVATGAAGGTLQPYSRLYRLKQTGGDKASRKDLHQTVVGSRGLDAGTGTKLTYYTRADPNPGFTNWGTGVDVTVGPTQAITPSETTSGYSLVDRIDFFAPSGGATPPAIPYLDSIRGTAWFIAPSTMVRTIPIAYGDDVLTLSNARDDSRDPDDITADLLALCGNRTILRDRQDKRWSVRVRQVFRSKPNLSDSQPYGKRIEAQIEVQILAGPL